MNIKNYSQTDVNMMVQEILRSMYYQNFRPDYIVGITRGGLVPALMLSHYLDTPMHALHASFKEHVEKESNLWMAEDAFGYNSIDNGAGFSDSALRKNILIVDDINDSGETFKWIKKDWVAGCLPSDNSWETIWGNNVKFAALVNNENSEFEVDFSGVDINRYEDDASIRFYWEQWWK